ncbi:uncharacterized protein LOC128396538 [Panonychus citri]|uniref:uncharacterized protein LOC128396538 n=1 Tax=Panonychus citri TaxID=50023 RepID=UPI00230706BC|nr:uncharacterized protein LOC128396538 [Panonychus citri]
MLSDPESTAKSSEAIEPKEGESSEQVKSGEAAEGSSETISTTSASGASSSNPSNPSESEAQPMEAEPTVSDKVTQEESVKPMDSNVVVKTEVMEASSDVPEVAAAESDSSKEKMDSTGSTSVTSEIVPPGGAEKVSADSVGSSVDESKKPEEVVKEIDTSEKMDATPINEAETSTVSSDATPVSNEAEAQNNITNGSDQSMEVRGPVEEIEKEVPAAAVSSSVQPSIAVSAGSGPTTPGKVVQASSPTPAANGGSKKPKVDYSTLPTRQYLDQTVVPILLQGLSSLAKARPEDPTRYLANYLIEHGKDFEDRQN